MIKQQKYINKIDHVWYDSSNVIYSACYDSDKPTKMLKIVFKGGRTYLYKDVDMNDYIMFARGGESTGEAVNKYIVKKYKGVRLSDTDLDALEQMRINCGEEDAMIEQSLSNLAYELQIDNKSGLFRLNLNGHTIFEGEECKFSIMRLFNAMHIGYALNELDGELFTEEKFTEEDIIKG